MSPYGIVRQSAFWRRGLGWAALGLLLPLVVGVAEPAAPVAGHWEGKISLPGTDLGILVDLSQAPDSAWSGTIDIPLQSAKGLALDAITVVADSVSFRISGIPGEPRFRGVRKGAVMEGTFSQGGQNFSFHLGREKIEPPKRPQEPKPPFPYRSEEVTYRHGEIVLAGTLSLPEGEGPFPAALLVSGSGPQNRDEELLGHKPFLVLSDHLTRAGIAVLRVDDRGVGGSSGKTMESTTDDFAGDALAGIDFLRTRKEINPRAVGIVGHSEGGLVGPLAASRSQDVAFVVMMAGTGVPGSEVVARRSEAISRAAGASPIVVEFEQTLLRRSFELVRSAPDTSRVRAELMELSAERLQGAPDSLRPMLEATLDQAIVAARSMSMPWFRFFVDYDPRPALRKVTVPVLVLNGEKDLQVLPDQNLPEIERALGESGNKDVTVRRLPGLNHVFQPAESGSPLEYAAIETTMDPTALQAISEWVLQRFGRR